MKRADAETPLRRARSPLMRWHRRIGITVAAIVVVVVVTGVLLNHAGGLGWHEKRISADWLYRWYGMEPKGSPSAYPVTDGWVLWLDGGVYVDGRRGGNSEPLVGAAAGEGLLAAISARGILLMTPQGDEVETLTGASLPPGSMTRAGVAEVSGQPSVVVEASNELYVFGEGFLDWRRLDETEHGSVDWSAPAQPPAEVVEAVLEAYRGEGINAHRLLLDLHSGRFFGPVGVWLVDLAAISLIFLIVTGVWYAARTRPNRR